MSSRPRSSATASHIRGGNNTSVNSSLSGESSSWTKTSFHPLANLGQIETIEPNPPQFHHTPSYVVGLSQRAFRVHSNAPRNNLCAEDEEKNLLNRELEETRFQLAKTKCKATKFKTRSTELEEQCSKLKDDLSQAKKIYKVKKSQAKNLKKQNAQISRELAERESNVDRVANLAKRVSSIVVAEQLEVQATNINVTTDDCVDGLAHLEVVYLTNENEQLRLENSRLQRETDALATTSTH